ncbi:MAG: copper oxidase, partial [Verrucomicrobia bacterium]
MITRRRFLTGTAAAAGGVTLLNRLQAADQIAPPNTQPKPQPPAEPGRDYTPVITPNNISLPWKIVGGVKVYHL